MNIHIDISDNADELGMRAAGKIASLIEESINKKGKARIILSTGMSQFETLSHLITYDLPWDKVEMFHLDEYVGLDESHPASFRKYLKERFVSKVNLKAAYFVEGVDAIPSLTRELRKEEIDIGVIGIGENGHIAFNDPPADFTTGEAYKVVTLDRRCREQQVGEGWFRTIDDVPAEAITMCVKEIMKSKHIVSAVPHEVKAEAIYNTITGRISQDVPATILKTHPDWNLFIDKDSASKLLAI